MVIDALLGFAVGYLLAGHLMNRRKIASLMDEIVSAHRRVNNHEDRLKYLEEWEKEFPTHW